MSASDKRLEELETAINQLKDANLASIFAVAALFETHPDISSAVNAYDRQISDLQAALITAGKAAALPASTRLAFDALRARLLGQIGPKRT